MILKPDDFEIGMYITVLDNLQHKKEIEAFEPETLSAGVKTIANQDRSGMGRVLQIVAINLPYIVCKNYDTNGNYNIIPLFLIWACPGFVLFVGACSYLTKERSVF